MYLVIDEQYRLYMTPALSGYVRSQTKKGHLSVVDLKRLAGMNLDGTWSEVQELPGEFAIDLPPVEEQLTPRSKWRQNSNHNHIAIVLWVDEGYVRYEAPWSQAGVLGKAEDSFRAHYTPLPPN